MGIVTRETALRKAEEQGLDLVQMAGNSEPVVCRLMDYGKHLFAVKKSQASVKKNQKRTQVKEVKFRLSTDDADYKVKLRNLERFLQAGDKSKISIRLRGREILRKSQGLALLERISNDLEDYGKVEQEPKMEGRQMQLTIAPLQRSQQPVRAKSDEVTEDSSEDSAKQIAEA